MRSRLALTGIAIVIMALASSAGHADQAAMHSIAGHGFVAHVGSGPEGVAVTHTHLTISAADTPGWLGVAVHRPRVTWGAPVVIRLDCVEIDSFSWTIREGGLVRGHDVFASGSSAGGKRLIRLRVFDRKSSTASASLLRDSTVVSPYRDSAPCGAPSWTGETFAWSHFRITHVMAA